MPNVFVVATSVFQESPEQLQKNHASVANQVLEAGASVKHVLVFDGPQATAFTPPEDVLWLRLPINANDAGATPRAIGAALGWLIPNAAGLLFLDADNHFDPHHIQTLWDTLTAQDADIVTCARRLISIDGDVMGPCTESDGDHFNDTNCYLFGRTAWRLGAAEWLCQPDKQALWSDRRMWQQVKSSGLRIGRSHEPTVNYITRVRDHYTRFGREPPATARNTIFVADSARYV